MKYILSNAVLFDGVSDDIVERASVLVEGQIIREVSETAIRSDSAVEIDCSGKFLMPGLIDAHFHAYGASLDFQKLDRMPEAVRVAHALRKLNRALLRGFTTVRDTGGGDVGLFEAVSQGLSPGPRFCFGGKALAQTGGHGDFRLPAQDDSCRCGYSGVISQVVDGSDSIRETVRNEFRRGADHIKMFLSGGVATHANPISMSHFGDDEFHAIVEEARRFGKYVVAHCHTDDSARRCVEFGVRSIDHGTEISASTAKMIAASGDTFVVPTVAVLHMLAEHWEEVGLSPQSVSKASGATDRILNSIENCRRAGVKLGLGTDIFGTELDVFQAREFRYRCEVDRPIDVLKSATSVNAEIMQKSGEIGTIAPGAFADLVLLSTSPLQDVTVFERTDENMPLIMKNGEIVKNTL